MPAHTLEKRYSFTELQHLQTTSVGSSASAPALPLQYAERSLALSQQVLGKSSVNNKKKRTGFSLHS